MMDNDEPMIMESITTHESPLSKSPITLIPFSFPSVFVRSWQLDYMHLWILKDHFIDSKTCMP